MSKLELSTNTQFPTERTLVTTVAEQQHLQRVFRLLAFEIPLQRLEATFKKPETTEDTTNENDEDKQPNESVIMTDKNSNINAYSKEHAKYLVTLQDEAYNGKELVTSNYFIEAPTLAEVLQKLGFPSAASPPGSVSVLGRLHVDELMWEVNDNLDGRISYHEFEQSYLRTRDDTTGLEPSDMFYLTCFLMFDTACSGRISLDDAMKIFYIKYGDKMEQELDHHFGKKLDEGALHVTFQEYFAAYTKRRCELIDQSIARSKHLKSSKRLLSS